MFLETRYRDLVAELATAALEQKDQRLAQGHSPAIRILLVTKYQVWEDLSQALDFFTGQASSPTRQAPKISLPNWGESYVQGAVQRQVELQKYFAKPFSLHDTVGTMAQDMQEGIQLELIGPLQRNKSAIASRLFHTIHSVASAKLIHSLEKSLARDSEDQQKKEPRAGLERGPKHLDIFLQYNASGEVQKNGCHSYDQLRILADELLEHSQYLRLRGLMCMGRIGNLAGSATETRKAFADCRRLASRLWQEYGGTSSRLLPQFELSMGMSGDYREALAEGSNVLRIGSLLFSG